MKKQMMTKTRTKRMPSSIDVTQRAILRVLLDSWINLSHLESMKTWMTTTPRISTWIRICTTRMMMISTWMMTRRKILTRMSLLMLKMIQLHRNSKNLFSKLLPKPKKPLFRRKKPKNRSKRKRKRLKLKIQSELRMASRCP